MFEKIVDKKDTVIRGQDSGFSISKSSPLPYVAVGFGKEKITIYPTANPELVKKNEILLKIDQRRFYIGPAFGRSYEPGCYKRTVEGKDEIYISGRGIKRPRSINYNFDETVNLDEYVKIVETATDSKVRKAFANIGINKFAVTVVMTDKLHYIKLVPYDPCDEHQIVDTFEAITDLYGTGAKRFPVGAFTFLSDTKSYKTLRVWAKRADSKTFSLYQKGSEFILVPADKKLCMVDAKTCKPSEWKGENGALCPDCHDGNLLNWAQEILLAASEELTALRKENEELKKKLILLEGGKK